MLATPLLCLIFSFQVRNANRPGNAVKSGEREAHFPRRTERLQTLLLRVPFIFSGRDFKSATHEEPSLSEVTGICIVYAFSAWGFENRRDQKGRSATSAGTSLESPCASDGSRLGRFSTAGTAAHKRRTGRTLC
jgi:hypothetical protein